MAEDKLAYNHSPLHIAAGQREFELYKLIFERTHIINPARSKDGDTPLHTAATEGYLEIVKHIASHLENKNPWQLSGVI